MIYNPVSTYRIQLSEKFNFSGLLKVIPYLHKLGIKTIYASPVFGAVPGSEHGYDVTDPLIINPEIGTPEQFNAVLQKLKELNMGWIQDIVPNHMAFSVHNPWIEDILEKGPFSEYASFFDIDWQHPDFRLNGKLMLPFLGNPLKEAIDSDEISVRLNDKRFVLKYYEHEYPMNNASYLMLIHPDEKNHLPEALKKPIDIFKETVNHPEIFEKGKELLTGLYHSNKEVKKYIQQKLKTINEDKDILSELIDKQYYAPIYWKETEKVLNYRRFFTVNGLICLKIEQEHVFNTYHSYINELCNNGSFQGLRIDHIDGLSDPEEYLNRIRSITGSQMHVTVEKILEKDEHLEKSWPVQGETGYEFMALVDQLFTNDKNERLIENAYHYWENNPVSEFSEVVYEKKRYILYYQMAGEMDNLYRLFVDLNLINSVTYNPNLMKEAIAAFLLHCPVYRIYNEPGIFNRQQTKLLNTIFEVALEKAPHLTKELNLLKSIFLTEKDQNSIEIKNADLFFKRCMQFTGPLMAKGLEDTAFYTFNRFIAHNEVGDTPARFGITPEKFHREMIRKHNDFPLSLNATSTHDTKRGEDARARLCVLSDIPKLWTEYTQNWNIMNRKYKIIDAGREVPTRNDEYFIYQSIVGSMSRDISSDTDFEERIIDYITKAMREGKTESSWEDPDEYYEENTRRFVHGILSPGSAFRKNLKRLLDKIAYLGTINSLSQLLVKCTVPGVPDVYQGSECGNFSFVDPDNRHPVNFVLLEKQMDEIVQKDEKLTGLWNTPFNPKLKLLLTHLLLTERKKHPEVFEKGEYIPLDTKGRFRHMILAFARRYAETTFITVIPLHTGSFFDDDSIADMSLVEWENTRIDIPDLWPGECINLLSNNILKLEKSLYISELFKEIPLGFMKAIKKQPERKAGILMHITSLPGKYETGDFGPEAYEFADFLKRNHQSCWQMLPLNPIYENGAYSPYSSLSAFAGNIYLISPELLFRQNLISELPDSKTSRSSSKVNYAGAVITKEKVIDQAFENFNKGASKSLEKEFEAFCKKEEFWLHDYALFITLKKKFHFTKWIEWPEKFRNRDKTTLKKFHEENAGSIKREKFAQLLFLKQWNELKNYCNTKGITIFGDMPIYVNYDSADVWSHPELFKLKSNKEIKAVAGVPPDYFSREGQLWGMPVYRWDEMKKNEYGWWKQRIKKNLELFDLLRLDHFRGFSTYWEVPAGEKTAVNGKWMKGPADNFFNALKKEFPRMPFIAEDLGDVDQEVYDLRDRFVLPGMRLMQFAFGTNSDTSVHAPHNHIYNSVVYTGTHDNNTTKGWFVSETKHSNRRHLNRYVGKKVRYRNVHLELIRMAYASVAKLAIIPIQDFMGMGSNGRMNIPSVEKGNWEWRLTKKQLKPKIEKRIKTFVKTFGRA